MVEVSLTVLLISGFIGIFMLFYIYVTAGNKNIRTFLIAALPFLRRGRVLNINFLKNRQVVFEMVKAEDNKLIKFNKEDGKDYIKNREITPGSSYVEPFSNSSIYFTMTGNAKTFDPTIEESQTALDEITQMKGFDLGQEVAQYQEGLSGKKEISGINVNTLFFVVVIALVFFGAMLYMMNTTLLEIGQVVG